MEWQKTLYGRYSMGLKKHPFLLFGLPFMATIFAGSIYLAEFTTVRYEQYDEKVTLMSEEEALSVDKAKRKVNMKDEYYVSKCGQNDIMRIVANCVHCRDYNNLVPKMTGSRSEFLV